VRVSYKKGGDNSEEGNSKPIVTDGNDYYPFGMNFIRNPEAEAYFGTGSYKNYKYNGRSFRRKRKCMTTVRDFTCRMLEDGALWIRWRNSTEDILRTIMRLIIRSGLLIRMEDQYSFSLAQIYKLRFTSSVLVGLYQV
jgi:hypothetical protein